MGDDGGELLDARSTERVIIDPSVGGSYKQRRAEQKKMERKKKRKKKKEKRKKKKKTINWFISGS